MSFREQPSTGIPHVLIVGGGISGLATAYYLQKQARAAGLPLRYTVLESGPVPGGKIATERVDGFVIEGGPDSFLAQKPWAEELCRELGLAGELIGTNDAQRAVFILCRGRLVPLPRGINLIVPTRLKPLLRSPLLSWPGKLRMALEPLVPARTDEADESIGSFVRRRFGREAMEVLAEPLMCGIHAGAPEELSLEATFARFRDMERKHGSLTRGMRRSTAQQMSAPTRSPSESRSAFLSLRGGVGRLIDALVPALVDGRVETGVAVSSLERDAQGYRVSTAAGGSYPADAVVLTTPAYVSARIVQDLAPSLADSLGRIRYVSSGTVSLAFRREEVQHPLNGFGFVVPRGERRRIFGCTWNSSKLAGRAPEGHVLLRAFVGGAGREEIVELPDQELVALVRAEFEQIMGLEAEPLLSRVYRWHHANPQYEVGHLQRVREMHSQAESVGGLYLTGSAFEGVGIPDCVRQAQTTASTILAALPRTRQGMLTTTAS